MRVTLCSHGDMCSIHGNFNNSLSSNVKSKRNLDRVASFHDLHIMLNKDLVPNDGVDSNKCIRSRYFSPHSFRVMKNQFCKRDLEHTFFIFHNNIRSLKKNLDNLQCEILDEFDFHFDLLGVTETKITPASPFFFQPVTEAEVRLEILSIPNGKSHGLYSCLTQMLKHAHQYLSEPLALLINTSVFQGAYPAKLKLSKVVPVFKADDAFDANNYRPISLLSNFNRIFEKLIYTRMLPYIEHNDILHRGLWIP